VAGLGELGAGILLYASRVLLSRSLGAEGVGIYSLAFTTLIILSIAAQAGLNSTVLRYVAFYRARGERGRLRGIVCFGTGGALLLGILLGGALYLAAPAIAALLFRKSEIVRPLQMVAPAIPLVALVQVWLSAMQGAGQIERRVAVEKLAWPALRLALFALVLLLGWGLWGVLGSLVAASLIVAVLAFALSQESSRPHRTRPAWAIAEWIGFSAPLLVDSLLTFGLARLDILALGRFRTAAEVGVYEAAAKTAMLVPVALFASNAVFAPMISGLYGRGDLKRLRVMFQTVTKWVFTASFPVFLLCLLSSRQILSIFGGGFEVGAVPLRVLALGQLANAGTGAVGFMLIMTGHTRLQMLNTLTLGGLSLILYMKLVPGYGMAGAAIASAGALAAINLLKLGEVYWLLRLQPYRSDFLKPLMAGLGAVLIAQASQTWLQEYTGELVATLAKFLLFGASYVAFLIIFRLNTEDQIVLGAMARRLRRSLSL